MIFTFIDGKVEVSERLLRECMADLKDSYPGIMVVVVSEETPSDAMAFVMDWMDRNDVPFSELDMAAAMSPAPDRVYALIGDVDPDPEVGNILKDALSKGIEVRDLAEAGVTVVRIDGTVPTTNEGDNVASADEENYTWLQLGLEADDDESDVQDEARTVIDEAFTERGLDGNAYETWTEMAVELGVQDEEEDSIEYRKEAAPVEEEPVEEEPEDGDTPRWTADDLKDIGVRKLREIAKASNIDAKLPKDKIIALLIGSDKDEEESDPESVGGETIEDRDPVPQAGEEDLPDLVERMKAVEERLAAVVESFDKLREALA